MKEGDGLKRATKAERQAVKDAKSATRVIRRSVAANRTAAIRAKARAELLREIGALRRHELTLPYGRDDSWSHFDCGPTDALRDVFTHMFGGYPEGLGWPIPAEEAQDVIDWINQHADTGFMAWSTGIGAFEAAEHIVNEAIANANIRPLDAPEGARR